MDDLMDELGKAEKQTKRYLENCVKQVLKEEGIWSSLNIHD